MPRTRCGIHDNESGDKKKTRKAVAQIPFLPPPKLQLIKQTELSLPPWQKRRMIGIKVKRREAEPDEPFYGNHPVFNTNQ
jgi:hypothetical protein